MVSIRAVRLVERSNVLRFPCVSQEHPDGKAEVAARKATAPQVSRFPPEVN